MFSTMVRREELGGALTAALLTIALTGWLLLVGVTPSAQATLTAFLFLLGSVFWARACRHLWDSQSSINVYLPLGFAINSLLSLVLLAFRQGTLPSAVIASLAGVICCHARRQTAPSESLQSAASVRQQPLGRGLWMLALAIVFSTILMAGQLHSIASLQDASTSTIFLGWTDVSMHANVVLSLSHVSWGSTPLSYLNPNASLITYHYGSYFLPALINSVATLASPLAIYIAVVAPLGLLLLLLPWLERLMQGEASIHWARLLWGMTPPVVVYAIWTRTIGDTSMDPAWLLITGPATLYACSFVLAGLQIFSDPQSNQPRTAIYAASFALAIFLLSLVFKFQISYSISLACILVVLAWALLTWRKREVLKAGDYFVLTGLVVVILVLEQLVYAKFNYSRLDPFKELYLFLVDLTSKTWRQPLGTNLSAGVSRALAPALGLATLTGPLFLGGWFLTAASRRSLPIGRGLIGLVYLSFVLDLLFSPGMPWDPSEFYNRSWPLLWCIGAWLWAGLRPGLNSDRQPVFRAALVASLVFAFIVLPAQKRASIASPPLADWSQQYFPTNFSQDDKRTAKRLAEEVPQTSFFFAVNNSIDGKPFLEDYPTKLAAMSGVHPVFTRLSYQRQIVVGKARPRIIKKIDDRYQLLIARSREACASTASTLNQLAAFKVGIQGRSSRVYALCEKINGVSVS